MSVEQWSLLALVILLPVLQAVAQLRRARADEGEQHSDRLPVKRRRSPLPSTSPASELAPLPQSAPDPAMPLAIPHASRPAASKRSRSLEDERTLSGDAVGQWLRPTTNLRRAIVVAAILGPPTQ